MGAWRISEEYLKPVLLSLSQKLQRVAWQSPSGLVWYGQVEEEMGVE